MMTLGKSVELTINSLDSMLEHALHTSEVSYVQLLNLKNILLRGTMSEPTQITTIGEAIELILKELREKFDIVPEIKVNHYPTLKKTNINLKMRWKKEQNA